MPAACSDRAVIPPTCAHYHHSTNIGTYVLWLLFTTILPTLDHRILQIFTMTLPFTYLVSHILIESSITQLLNCTTPIK